jgi:GAF domain-containing protein
MKCPWCQQDTSVLDAQFCPWCGASVSQSASGAKPYGALKDENDVLRRSLSEALEQQAATSEILRVISRSQTDVQPVFDAIAANAARLCDAVNGMVIRFDGRLLHLAAHYNVEPERLAAVRAAYPRPPSRGALSGRAILTRAVVHVPDVSKDPEYTLPVATTIGYRSVLAVPMMHAGIALGTILVARDHVAPFSETHIALIQTFADQAVIAIENVRLFTELQEKNQALTRAHAQVTEALDQQTATADILSVISRSPSDIQPVFDAIVQNAVRLCEGLFGAVLRLDGDRLYLAAHYNLDAAGVQAYRDHYPVHVALRETVASTAVLDRRIVQVIDSTDPAVPSRSVAMARAVGFRGVLVVPMLRDGEPIGVINVARRERGPFTERQVVLLKTFADQAVIAIENVRLFTELQEKNRALIEAHAQVTQALDQQTATSEILRTIALAQTEVQQVFDTIVRNAARLCHAVHAAVFVTDGRTLFAPANYGSVREALAAARARFPRPLAMDSTASVAILTRAIVHVPDVEEPSTHDFVRQSGQLIGFRSVVTVPMLREGEAVGAILVARQEAGRFPDSEVNLLKTFADQAVIAIENVRLFTELQRKNEALTEAHAQVSEALDRQTATADILRAISHSPTDYQPIFDAIVRSAVRVCGAADASLHVVDGDRLPARAHCGPIRPVSEALTITRDFVTGRAVVEARPVQVEDLRDADEFPVGRDLARRMRYRTVLGVPLLRDGVAIGVIGIRRTDVRPFTENEITLLQTFADQAVIAIENVRLFNELQASNRDLKEALEQQTATAEILRVISQSQADVQPVFDAIADSSMRLLEASAASVARYDSEMVSLMAARGGLPGSGDAAKERFQPPHRPRLGPEQALVTKSVHHVVDIDIDASCSLETRRHMAERGIRSFVAVPMLRGSDALGMIVVSRAQSGGFTAAEIALLQTFADQAAIAIENARLLSELQTRTRQLTRSVEQLTALGEVSRAVSSTLDPGTVLTTIVSRAVALSGLDGGVVFEYDEDEKEFVHRAQADTGGALASARRGTRVRKGDGVVGLTAITLEPVQVDDIAVPGAYVGPNRENLIESGVRAILAVPMLREGQLIGCLGVTRNQPGNFSTETIQLLRTFATQSALAIQNARLYQEIEAKSQQLEAASQHKSEFLANMSHELRTPLNAVIGFSEVLRDRMFGDLNDKQEEYLNDIHASGQHLLSLINDILDLSKIEAGRMELELTDVHLPSALDNAMTLMRERAGRHSIALHMHVDPQVGYVHADERKIKQVVLNLLSNAIKFTPEGGRIELRATRGDGVVEVAVSDTGVGIAPEDQEAVFEEFRQVGTTAKKVEGTGLGLALSRKFIELHGGRIWVDSQVGTGSTFTLTIPMRSGA